MGPKRSILIVDDDRATCLMVKMLLDRTGLYAVTICTRGSKAFGIVQETRPDLVLLDIMMPDTDGTDIADQIKNDKSLAHTKVVFLTSLVSQKEVHRHAVIGGRAFISKPFSDEVLLQRVKELFEVGS